MSSVPIVQGVAVDPNNNNKNTVVVAAEPAYTGYQDSPVTDYGGTTSSHSQYQGMQHTKQPNQFRDVFWAILFVGHLIPLVLYATYVTSSSDDDNNATSPITVGPHLVWLSTTALVSVGLASLSLEGMMHFADILVKISLIFSVCFSGLLGVYGILSGQMLMTILGFVSFAIGYVLFVVCMDSSVFCYIGSL